MIAEKELKTEKTVSPGRKMIMDSIRFAADDPKKSWYYTLSTLFLMTGAFWASYFSSFLLLKAFFGIVAGLLIVRFFIIYHDYQHGAILSKSKAAKWVMSWYGVFVMAPPNIWKRTHDHHHNNNSKLSNSGIGSYPLVSKSTYLKFSKREKFMYKASRHPLTILFGYISLFILDFNVKSLFRSPKNHWDSFLALAFHFGLGTFIFFNGGIAALLLGWMLPFFVANGLGAYLFYAQHNFPGAVFREGTEWDYTLAALDSTSFLVMNPVMNWFTGNIGYHHVHHVNHRIPFYRLKEAMHGLPELQQPKTTTLSPKDILACLKLKLWDPEKGQMISYPD